MNIYDFKTKSEYIPRKNVSVDGYWPIGIDVGYSGVKVYAPNAVLCFPSFARVRREGIAEVGKMKNSDILYRDDKGVLWDVREMANNSLSPNDVDDSMNTLYSRYRYHNPMFKTLAETSMAMAMRANKIGAKKEEDKLKIVSGLPAKYHIADAAPLRNVLEGHHRFDLKIGSNPWETYEFEIEKEDLVILQQPLGAYYSTCLNNNADMTALGNRIYRKLEVVIMDGGFGTIDGCLISAKTHKVTNKETFPAGAMKEIFRRTVADIQDIYGTEIAVHAFQRYLQTGKIPVVDRVARRKKEVSFADILERHTRQLCIETMTRMELAYDSFIGTDMLVVAGGTGAAWYEQLKDRYKEMGIEVIQSSPSDNLSSVYDIVRGYYLFLASMLKRTK